MPFNKLIMASFLLLMACIFLSGCTSGQISRAARILNFSAARVRSYELSEPTTERVNSAFNEGKRSLGAFQKQSTRKNLRNVITTFQNLKQQGKFHTSQQRADNELNNIVNLILEILDYINPPILPNDEEQKIVISKEQKKVLDEKLEELEQMMKPSSFAL